MVKTGYLRYLAERDVEAQRLRRSELVVYNADIVRAVACLPADEVNVAAICARERERERWVGAMG